MKKTIFPMFFYGNLPFPAGNSFEEVLPCFCFRNSHEKTSVSNLILGNYDEKRRFSNRFSRILVLNAGFQASLPGSKPEKSVFQSAFAGSHFEKWIAD